MKRIMVATAVAALLVTPAFAQSPGSPHKAQARHKAESSFNAVTPTPFDDPMPVSGSGRDAAIRECNAMAAKTYWIRDSSWPMFLYRSCMTWHGQAE